MHICYKACRFRKMKFLIERVNYWYKLGMFYITIYVHIIIDVKYFPKGFFRIGNFPRVFLPNGNFPNVQSPKRQLPMSSPAAALGPQLVIVAGLGTLAAALGPYCSLRCLRGWEVATWKIVTWEVALGTMPLGKYPTPNYQIKIDFQDV